MRYVVLGDSYSIGTAVAAEARWPNQLAARIDGLEVVANLAVNGFTSGDVIDVQLPRVVALRPDIVSLLVGVNDVIQGVSEAGYEANLGSILAGLRGLSRPPAVFGVTTPDYTVTPAGAEFGDPAATSARIRRFNGVFRAVLAKSGSPVVDVHDLSLRVAADPSLVAGDGLHPSGRQYGLWVERIEPVVRGLAGG